MPLTLSVVEKILQRSAGRVRWPKRTEIEIVFVSDSQIRKWNKMYRGKDRATNVLSFGDLKARPFMGQVLIALGVLRREAKSGGWTLRSHASRLFVHGLLHIAGYDHERERDAREMERLEHWILQPFHSSLT